MPTSNLTTCWGRALFKLLPQSKSFLMVLSKKNLLKMKMYLEIWLGRRRNSCHKKATALWSKYGLWRSWLVAFFIQSLSFIKSISVSKTDLYGFGYPVTDPQPLFFKSLNNIQRGFGRLDPDFRMNNTQRDLFLLFWPGFSDLFFRLLNPGPDPPCKEPHEFNTDKI